MMLMTKHFDSLFSLWLVVLIIFVGFPTVNGSLVLTFTPENVHSDLRSKIECYMATYVSTRLFTIQDVLLALA